MTPEELREKTNVILAAHDQTDKLTATKLAMLIGQYLEELKEPNTAYYYDSSIPPRITNMTRSEFRDELKKSIVRILREYSAADARRSSPGYIPMKHDDLLTQDGAVNHIMAAVDRYTACQSPINHKCDRGSQTAKSERQ